MLCLFTLGDTLNCEIYRRTLVQCTDTIVVSNIDPIGLERRLYSKVIICEAVYKIVKDKKTGDTSTDHDKTFQTLCLSVQPILKINKQNQAIYTTQQPIKLHLMSP